MNRIQFFTKSLQISMEGLAINKNDMDDQTVDSRS